MPKPTEVGVRDMYRSAIVAGTLATLSRKRVLRWVYVMKVGVVCLQVVESVVGRALRKVRDKRALGMNV